MGDVQFNNVSHPPANPGDVICRYMAITTSQPKSGKTSHGIDDLFIECARSTG